MTEGMDLAIAPQLEPYEKEGERWYKIALWTQEEGRTLINIPGTADFRNPSKWDLTYIEHRHDYVNLLKNPGISYWLLAPLDLKVTTEDHPPDDVHILHVEDPAATFLAIHNAIYRHVVYEPMHHDGPRTAIIMGQTVPWQIPIGNHGHIPTAGRVHIGSDVELDPGVVIGTEGFKLIRNFEGNLERLKHIGGVKIGRHVEIGSNTVIDRGTFGDTIIGDYSKLDNNIHISHNDILGKNVLVCAHVTIAGSCIVGDNAEIWVGAQIRQGITIGDGAVVNMGAIVTRDVPAGTVVAGHYAMTSGKWNSFVKRTSRGE